MRHVNSMYLSVVPRSESLKIIIKKNKINNIMWMFMDRHQLYGSLQLNVWLVRLPADGATCIGGVTFRAQIAETMARAEATGTRLAGMRLRTNFLRTDSAGKNSTEQSVNLLPLIYKLLFFINFDSNFVSICFPFSHIYSGIVTL